MDIKELARFDLHTHSHYSNLRLIDSINRPRDLIFTAAKLGLKGICLTDHETVAGHIDFLNAEKELKKQGLIPEDFKCACGNEIYLVDDRNNVDRYYHYILAAKNTRGHKALRELSSTAWLNGFSSRGMMRVPTTKEELVAIVKKYPGTLIASSACLGSELDHFVVELCKEEKKKIPDAGLIYSWKSKIDAWIKWNKELFGDDFYLELQAGVSKEQILFNERIWGIAAAYGVKVILTSDAHYLTEKDRPVHKAYLNSKDGEREVDEFYEAAHLMDNEEAFTRLEKSGYFKEQFVTICRNTMEIYDKIEGYELGHRPIIPRVEVKDYPKLTYQIVSNNEDSIHAWTTKYPTITKLLNSDNIQERYWVNECLKGLKAKDLSMPEYFERLETEARVIDILGHKLDICLFEYFNTFQHYINLFWDCGSIVEPGRGSSVCFLSNYLLGITQVDSLKYNLRYWRFLNEERIELPDIDIDLAPSKRKKIFEAIRKERGEFNVVQVCTYGTEGTRSAIAAACRGYRSEQYPEGIDIDTSQYLSSLIPQERGFLWSIHDAVDGNEEKGRKPIAALIAELDKYPGLLDIIKSIEGLVNKRGQHASGVILYNDSPFDTNALMRSPNGDITTQYDLHMSETLGDVKYDFLVTEICDKLTIAIDLLQKDGVIEENLGLRQVYDKYLHPSVINLEDNRLWDALGNGKVLDVFQFSTGVGLATAKHLKPTTILEMVSANGLMRLMGEEGEERPLDRYCRLKADMREWYDEVHRAGLSEKEIKDIEPYYLPNFGVPCTQEDLMEVCLDENIAHFTLKEANAARKIVAKKKMDQIPELKEKFISQCPSRALGEYVWKTTMGPQMGYSFAKPHALAYSFVGVQTLILATYFPDIYWNCACLIVNAGGADLLDADDIDREDGDEDTPTKVKNKSVNYGKISVALGKSKRDGMEVTPPDINRSDLIFKPDSETNSIIYGLKGIDCIGTALVYEIIANRPYTSMEDFMSKVKVNKTQMISLIKAGAFDTFYADRMEAMTHYLDLIADKKKRITLQNMMMLINKDLIPKEFEFEVKVYNFNKYLKQFKDGNYYKLDSIAMRFFAENYDSSVLEDAIIDNEYSSGKIKQTIWDNIYKKEMDPIRDWMKNNQIEILDKLNNTLYQEVKEKYAEGSIDKWDMDSLGTYCHDHELKNIRTDLYKISNFEDLDEEPIITSEFAAKDGGTIRLYEIYRICGTVIDKDKNKSTITLLTPTMQVVPVKVWKNQYAKWDRQISRKNPDGTKTIVEKSFFARGNKLVITGIRRGDDFVPKKYKSTSWPLFEKIEELDDRGFIIKSSTERAELDEN